MVHFRITRSGASRIGRKDPIAISPALFGLVKSGIGTLCQFLGIEFLCRSPADPDADRNRQRKFAKRNGSCQILHDF